MLDKNNSEKMNVESSEEDDDSEHGDEEMAETVDNEESNTSQPKVYLPGQPLPKGEELTVDKSAYRILHEAQSGAPCLSFDIIPDNLGDNRENYPLTMYLLAGTQAARTHVNKLLVMKMTNLCAIEDEDSDSSDSDDSETESDASKPVMRVASMKHQGCVNRIRCTKMGNTMVAASWSELGRVSLWNLNEQLKATETEESLSMYCKKYEKSEKDVKPVFTFKGHLVEGYGLDWCPTEAGTLASGDCNGNIHIWRNASGTEEWHVDQRPYNSHAPHSVEDLQWSPIERQVLASCSVDKSIKIWDTRANPQAACMLTATGAHSADINVISWNRKETQFLVSGGDDGLLCIWDLRQFSGNGGATPVATFKQHISPVTTVEWHPTEATVFASGGSDDQIAQWDLAVETDDSTNVQDKELSNLPPQLLFIHQGQTDIKELHWHPQCPGTIVSTAHSGFNIFRTISV